MRPLVALALFVALAPAAPVPKGLKKPDDKTGIVGRWKPNEGERLWYEFRDDGTLRVNERPTELNGVAQYKWTLDSASSPKRMTWYAAGTTTMLFECVYELDGDDLRLNYSSSTIPKAVGPDILNYSTRTRDTPAK